MKKYGNKKIFSKEQIRPKIKVFCWCGIFFLYMYMQVEYNLEIFNI